MSLKNTQITSNDNDIKSAEMVDDADWKTDSNNINNQNSNAPVRCPSEISTLSTNQDICRICHCEGDSHENVLVAPCYCSGSLQWVHQQCLQQWIKSSDIKCCELCKFQFIMHTRLKAFSQWEGLQMTTLEKRKLICNITFQAAALTCVAWSLYVLIDRTAEELQRGLLEWPFWTKLIVVAIGFSGGVVFMYFQCKTYVNLIRRWKAYNRVIYVQNAPEKQLLPSDSSKIQQIMTDNSSQMYNCPKSNSINLNNPSHSLLSNGELGLSKDDNVAYGETKYKSLQQVLTTHYNINIGCDKNEALKTVVDKERINCKKEIDVSSDEGETYGLLNI